MDPVTLKFYTDHLMEQLQQIRQRVMDVLYSHQLIRITLLI